MKPDSPELFCLPNEDAICQAIFAGTIALGRPDAVFARELTDGVMHFIVADADHLSQDDVNDTVVKLVRELGHPQLAQVLDIESITTQWTGYSTEQQQPPVVLSRERVYPSNLIAAHDAGLIRLCDLEMPHLLIGGVLPRPLDPAPPCEWTKELRKASSIFGSYVVFNGAEHYVGTAHPSEWLKTIAVGLQSAGLRGVIELNVPYDESDSPKSLFSPRQPSLWGEKPTNPARELLQAWEAIHLSEPPWYCRWHLTATDFADHGNATLHWLARSILRYPELTVALDRPQYAHTTRSSVLLRVEMSLAALCDYLPVETDADTFIAKSGSLTRLALSAGHAKRAFLRAEGSPALRSGFLVEHSWLEILVTGLAKVAEHYFSEANNARRAFLSQIQRQVQEAIAADSHHQSTLATYRKEPKTIAVTAATSNESLPEFVANVDCNAVCVNFTPDADIGRKLISLLELLWMATKVEQVTFSQM